MVTVILIAVTVVAFVSYLQIRKADSILTQEKLNVQQSASLPVQARAFSLAPRSDAKLLTGPYEIRDLIPFQGRIYAATSNGLVILSLEGRKLEHWTSLEGLPSQDLTSLAVSGKDLWIGTGDSGLLRFDGSWTHFLPPAQHRSVKALLANSRGILLAGTQSGIISYNEKTFESFLPTLQESITSLAQSQSRLYVGTFQNGLYVHEGGVSSHFGKEEGLLDELITHMKPVAENLYVSTPSGIQVFEKGKFTTLAKNLFVTSFEPVDSIVWTATRDRGFVPLAADSRKRILSMRETPAPRFIAAAETQNNKLIKRIENGLLAVSQSEIQVLSDNSQWKEWHRESAQISNANISALLRNRDGELWIGYFDDGIDIVSGSNVTHLKDETLFCVNHLSEDANGRVYVSTSNGLAVFERDRTHRVYRTTDGLLSDRVMQTIPLDPDGKRVAIATTQGFTLKEGDAFRSIYAFHGLVNNHIYTMAQNRGDIFVGTLGGLSRISRMQVTGNWTQMDSGLKRNWINALMTVNDRLFVGTYGSGIQVRNASGDWFDFPELPEDLEINPNSLFYDGRFLFCGTLDRGFFVYDPSRNVWKHVQRDLPALNVTSFAADSDTVYIGTDRGLLQIKYDKISTIPDLS